MELRGATGELRWVYMVAAVIGPWKVSSVAPGELVLDAAIVSHDTYRLTQHDLTAHLRVGKRIYTWSVESITFWSATRMTVKLGAREP